MNRREWIASLLGCHVAASVGCSRQSLPPEGELLSTNFRVGHQVRDGHRPQVAGDALEDIPVVIIGGGIAGLSAAWRLLRAGMDDFVMLELEDRAGGTARGGATGSLAYPWGAHYIPVPMATNGALISLLEEMKVVEGRASDGSPVIGEQYLCRDPHERLFYDGQWHEGIFPIDGASPDDLRQLDEFRAEIDRWVEARDHQGRPMFTVPMAHGSDAPEVRALDQQSMAQWMDQRGWSSPRLRWFVDYACRDDYGLSIERVSAWAGVFYFAARVPAAGQEAQSVITWPEGNARVGEFLIQRVGNHLRYGYAACEIHPLGDASADGGATVVAMDTRREKVVGLRAQQVIFAAPQMLVKHLAREATETQEVKSREAFQYGSWIVANVHLRDRPRETGFPMCWDNVIYGTKSLGYVTATHQTGIDHGPTVLTWYYPFADVDPRIIRQQMLQLQWSDWADLVMTDLRVAHQDIDDLVTRIDIMLWGHAMIQPHVGFVWSKSRLNAAQPIGSVHFAGTDLSGIALFEEAFYHGIRAAEEVMVRRTHKFQTLLPTSNS